MANAWRNFKNIFSRPLFTIIVRPDMLKFHPYSILTREIMVGFVIYCTMNDIFSGNHILYSFQRLRTMHPQIFVLFKKTICTLIINSFS